MTPETLIARVCRCIDALIAAGDNHSGLFPSMLDLESKQMLLDMPDPIDGQRNGDRAYLGSNLIHDEAVLHAMLGLSEFLGRDDYAAAADRYLKRFADHCTNTVSGLFPWGEHAYWHLIEDRIGNSYADAGGSADAPVTHDHLRHTPRWLWEKLHAFNPPCVERFAEGLNNHWTEGQPGEYIRHARVMEKRHHPRTVRSCDFPRHSGFYIADLAFAAEKTGRADFLDQLDRFLTYWWDKRDDDGQLLIESRTPIDDPVKFHNVNAPAQTLSLAVSLLESEPVVRPLRAELADCMRVAADLYIDGFFAASHDIERGEYVLVEPRDPGEQDDPDGGRRLLAVWGSRYGHWPLSYVATYACSGYRLTGDDRLLSFITHAAELYASTPIPADVATPSMDAGLAVELLAETYAITGDARWLDDGFELADRLLPHYDAGDLFRGAAGIGWYESQMGPGFLVHGMARLAMLAANRECCPLDADYTAR